MDHIDLSPRALVALGCLALACVAGLVKLGNPEPALPRCNPEATYQMRCRP